MLAGICINKKISSMVPIGWSIYVVYINLDIYGSYDAAHV